MRCRHLSSVLTAALAIGACGEVTDSVGAIDAASSTDAGDQADASGGDTPDATAVSDATDHDDDATEEHLIFISSQPHPADTGLAGFDALCATLAQEGNLAADAWVAVIQTAAVPLTDRVEIRGPVVTFGGQVVANNEQEFFSGTAQHPVDLSELGEPPQDTTAWVGGALNGVVSDCVGWSTTAEEESGVQAASTSETQWLYGASFGPCNLQRSIYCISQ
jgi:hypothetical protein